MAQFGIAEANKMARMTVSESIAYLRDLAQEGRCSPAATRRLLGSDAKIASSQQPANSAVAQQTVKPSTPMTQDQRDDASVRELRALAASAGLKGFGEPDATNAVGEADDLLSLAAAVGLRGFVRQEGQE